MCAYVLHMPTSLAADPHALRRRLCINYVTYALAGAATIADISDIAGWRALQCQQRVGACEANTLNCLQGWQFCEQIYINTINRSKDQMHHVACICQRTYDDTDWTNASISSYQ